VRKPKEHRAELPGDLVQVDTVAIFAAGLKRYIFMLDIRTRFAFAYSYKANTALMVMISPREIP
jgi:hypothetical protein